MTLHLTESDVRQLLTMPVAIAAVEEISRKQAQGTVIVHPRRRFELPGGAFFHYMAAADTEANFLAMKQYTYVKGTLRFLVPLYDMSTGTLLALIEADYMGQLRTGAASGVATNHLARQNVRTAAILGSGGQAKTQLEAIAAVRKLESVLVYSRDPQNRNEFAEEMSRRLHLPVTAADSAAAAVRHADIIITATRSSRPVFDGRDLTPGAHINAIGANHANKRELDEVAVDRASVIFVDSLEQSRQEAGDLIIPFQNQPQRWEKVHELAGLVAGKIQGRTSNDQITLFKSNGIASWDLAVATQVYAQAKERSLGNPISLFTESM